MNHWASLSIVLALVSCSSSRGRSPAQRTPAAEVRRIPVSYSAGAGPYIITEAAIGSVRGLFIIDSGTAEHVLDASWARRAGLATAPAGDVVRTEDGELPRYVSLGGELQITGFGRVALARASIVRWQLFEELGVAGVLSPQQLAAGGGVVILDIAHQHQRPQLAWTTGPVTFPAERSTFLTTCHEGLHGVFILRAQRGETFVRLILDTGRPKTCVFGASSGATGLEISLGSHRRQVAFVPCVRAVSRCGGGLLGLDALGGCTLIIHKEEGTALYCGSDPVVRPPTR